MITDSHNTWFGGMKQKLHDLKINFNKSLANINNTLEDKFESINKKNGSIVGNIKTKC